MESLSAKLELSGTTLGPGYILPICSKSWSFSLSLQKKSNNNFGDKEWFWKCTFPGFYCKIVKQYGPSCPFIQYQGSLLPTRKINYRVSCSKVSSSDHQPQDTTTTDSGLRCSSEWLLLLQLWQYPYLLMSKQQARRPVCKVQMLHLTMECLFINFKVIAEQWF